MRCINYNLRQSNKDPLDISSITKNKIQAMPRMSNIYPHGKQSQVMGGVKFETVHDVLT